MKDQQHLDQLRHSTAHLIAAAALKLYPNTKLTIGPAIENGFYYDFDFSQPISDDDLPKLEKEMATILKTWKGFSHREVSEKEAKETYKNNEYKLELIDDIIKRGEKITLYKVGDFEDLCRGGHSEDPKKDIGAFKLLSIAGAYWRGDEKNKMITRIYGTAFPTKKELDEHLQMLEEAKKRDHRKLGRDLGLFIFEEEVGSGLPILLPKGETIKHILMELMRNLEEERGYKYISSPVIASEELYKLSGHQKYYHDDMYQLQDKEEKLFYIKAMSCPHHHMVYRNMVRSYRDLPLKLAEAGTVYRNELSGTLTGLIRVRGPITQNDSHIYCTPDQLKEELAKVIQLFHTTYKMFGLEDKYWYRLSLPDFENKRAKYPGDPKRWEFAANQIREVLKEEKANFVEEKGEAAFYGPKLDIQMKNVSGKEDSVATAQIDILQPEWMGLKYDTAEGTEERPYVIHRAILGSYERFMGFLIEHYAGAFPLWLAPVQVVLLPIADRHAEGAQKVAAKLAEEGIRVEVDARSERLQAKIRDATLQKVPFMSIIGDKEIDNDSISVRKRNGEDLGQLKTASFLEQLLKHIAKKETI
ncbi:MAG: threonine--tRNA ligase [Candidatus Levyibacteriota bacterium]